MKLARAIVALTVLLSTAGAAASPTGTDIAVSNVAVEVVPIATDNGPLVEGPQRSVQYDLTNLGAVAAVSSVAVIATSTTDAHSTVVAEREVQIPAGRTLELVDVFSTLEAGLVGDMVVTARASTVGDPNPANDEASAVSYSAVRDLGAGATLGVDEVSSCQRVPIVLTACANFGFRPTRFVVGESVGVGFLLGGVGETVIIGTHQRAVGVGGCAVVCTSVWLPMP